MDEPHSPALALSISPAARALISQRTPFRFHEVKLGGAASQAPADTDTDSGRGASTVLEPFLPLSSPSPTSLPLILTPPRPSDPPALVRTLNDPRVAFSLVGPPYPYTEEIAREWNDFRRKAAEEAFKKLAQRAEEERLRREEDPTGVSEASAAPWIVDGLPVGNIRRADTGEWVGDFGLPRWNYEDTPDEVERDQLLKENDAKEAGEPSIIWTFGFFLNPDYHGKGIMQHVLRTVLSTYVFPFLRADEIRGAAFTENRASIRTQEKCGFQAYYTFKRQISEARGGGTKEVTNLRLRRVDFERA
ncbi:GNAT family N-acetyltransferase [Rhodotorula paludigena]|uniref:GNAT family N-acetyltransferase n=1 Tax=Rhodotorula paludigena TaxID=86838 RepID=UPI0031791DCE